jgi:hypothetical protein
VVIRAGIELDEGGLVLVAARGLVIQLSGWREDVRDGLVEQPEPGCEEWG